MFHHNRTPTRNERCQHTDALSYAVSTVAYNYSYIRESTHIISKNKTQKTIGEEYLIWRQYENANISSDIQPQLQWISSTNRKDDDWANIGEMRLSFVPRKFGTIPNSAEGHCPEAPGCCCCIEAVNLMWRSFMCRHILCNKHLPSYLKYCGNPKAC